MTTTAGSPPAPTPAPKSSFDKARAMKMFMAHSRSSSDRDVDSQLSHKKSDSLRSEKMAQGYPTLESTTFDVSSADASANDARLKVCYIGCNAERVR